MKILKQLPTRAANNIRVLLEQEKSTRTATSQEQDSMLDDSVPFARTLDEFVKLIGNDPAELLKHRYLCRRGGLLLVGPTGHGKSSLAMQLMIKWSLGQSVFSLEPARPLKRDFSVTTNAANVGGVIKRNKPLITNHRAKALLGILLEFCQQSSPLFRS